MNAHEFEVIKNKGVYIGFKTPDGTLRATLKQKGIKIVNLLFDRVPALTPR